MSMEVHEVNAAEPRGVSIAVDRLDCAIIMDRHQNSDGSTVKFLLSQVSCNFASNKLVALMGPSGSGKTTLLNTLAGKVSGSTLPPGSDLEAASQGITKSSGEMRLAGEVYYNGLPGLLKSVPLFSGYVMQRDVLLEFLTVEETLTFASRFKLKLDSKTQRKTAVERVIKDMCLEKCRHTPIGGFMQKGVSGGEKKRTALAIELLADPKLIFLDEPTSGLDTSLAYEVCRLMGSLAVKGTTVIVSIHQPRSQLFAFFDHLLLLAPQGRVAFNGHPRDAAAHFAKMGFPCPPHFNPADLYLDLLTANKRLEDAGALDGPPDGGNGQVARSNSAMLQMGHSGSFLQGGSFAGGTSLIKDIENVTRSLSKRRSRIASSDDAESVPRISVSRDAEKERRTRATRVVVTEAEIRRKPEQYDMSEYKLRTMAKVQYMVDHPREKPEYNEAGDLWQRARAWFSSVSTSADRVVVDMWRNPAAFLGDIFVQFIVCMFMGAVFYHVQQPSYPFSPTVECDFQNTHNLGGAIAALLSNIAYSNFMNCARWPLDRCMFNREVAAGFYRRSAGYMGITLAQMVFDYFIPLVYGTILYFFFGFKAEAGPFFSYMAVLLALKFSSTALSYFCGTISPNMMVSLGLVPGFNTLFMLVSGFIMPDTQLPSWIQWLKYISYIHYGYIGVLQTQVDSDTELHDCYGVGTNFSLWENFGLLLVVGVGFRLVAWISVEMFFTKQGLQE